MVFVAFEEAALLKWDGIAGSPLGYGVLAVKDRTANGKSVYAILQIEKASVNLLGSRAMQQNAE